MFITEMKRQDSRMRHVKVSTTTFPCSVIGLLNIAPKDKRWIGNVIRKCVKKSKQCDSVLSGKPKTVVSEKKHW
jgi:hypothetical protein